MYLQLLYGVAILFINSAWWRINLFWAAALAGIFLPFTFITLSNL